MVCRRPPLLLDDGIILLLIKNITPPALYLRLVVTMILLNNSSSLHKYDVSIARLLSPWLSLQIVDEHHLQKLFVRHHVCSSSLSSLICLHVASCSLCGTHYPLKQEKHTCLTYLTLTPTIRSLCQPPEKGKHISRYPSILTCIEQKSVWYHFPNK